MNMNKIQKLLLTVVCLFAVTATWGYDITVITNEANKATNNGYLTTNVSTAGTSTLVTITAHPNDGYYVNTPVVTLVANGSSANAPRRAPGIGDTVTPTLVSANTYQFSMSNYDVEITATFTACTDIGSATVFLTEGTRNETTGHYSQEFDFLTHSPKINSVTLNTETLTEGTDYTVSELGNYTNAETYPITLTGKGKYKGTKTVNYVISPLSISTATINLSGNNFVYDHTQHKPTITHVYLRGQELSLDQDYHNVIYSDNTDGGSTNAGNYTITISGMGNFTGTCQATYSIAKKHISACTISTPSGTSFIFTGSEKVLTVAIKDGGYTLVSGTDYTMTGHTQTNVGAYTATISAKEVNYTGTAAVAYTINASNDGYYIDVIPDQTYTGSPIEPDKYTTSQVVVKKQKGTTADPTQDPVVGEGAYYLVYNNNINVGIATVNAVGKDGYSFMATQTFNIVEKSIENATITLSDFTTKKNNSTTNNCFMYNGSNQKPTVTVMDGTKQLLSGTDYILTNNGGISVGDSYTVSIAGIGNYKGSKTSSLYSIIQKPLTGADITLSTTTMIYDGGNAKKPDVTLVKTTDGVIAYPSEYDVTWTNYTDAGNSESTNKPTVTVTAKSMGSNFSGSCSVYYTIEPKTITSDMVTLSSTASNWVNNSFTYNGSIQTPTVTVQYQYLPDATPTTPTTKTLDSSNDYTLTNAGGKEVGVYHATVVGKGNYKGTVNAPYSIVSDNDEDDIYITLASSTDYDYTYTGSPKKPGVTVTKGTGSGAITLDGTENKDYELVYNNNVNAGQASVTVIGKGNYHFVKNQEFTIAKRDFSTDTGNKIQISLSSASFVYNGSKQRPVVTVTDTNAPTGNQVLTENKDYTLSEGNINVGTGYKVTITGMGNYTGAKTSATTYAITTLDMTTTNTIVTLEYNSTVYNRSEQKPKIERVTVNGIQLNEGDYSVTYPTSDYTNQGTKTITISGAVNFGGSKDVTYTIAQKPITSSMVTLNSSNQTTDPFVNNSFTYNGSAHVPVVTVKDGEVTLTPSTTTDDNEYKLTNAGGTAVGVYYAKVEGKGNYTGKVEVPYSIVSNNSDTGVSVTYEENDDDIIYTGNPITLTLTVTKDNNQLTEGKNNDYEVVYNNNTNAGQATISVIGRNNYNFVKHIQFTIKKRPLTAAMVTLPGYTSDFVYNGNVQKPVVKVSYSSKDLIEGTDYKLTNNGITDVGDGYYKIEGDGNFTGTLESTDTGMPVYKITALSIVGAEISLIPLADPMYNGGEKKPSVQKIKVTPVANGPSYVFTSGYTVSYENNTDVAVGTTQPTVKVTGGTNFGGTIATTTFTITPKPLADDMVVLTGVPTGGYTYDGNPKTPGATVTDNALLCENKVVPASNYTISYSSDNINPGDKVATITGQNNYTGSVDKPFVINPIGGSTDVTITLTDVPSGGYVYDGTAKTPTVTVTKGTGDSPTTLTGETDYSVAYSDNTNAGTATVTVTGIGNYDFTQTKTFSIAQKAMTDGMVALSGIPTGGYTYDATLKKPVVTVSDGTPSIITADDYTISNEGNINAGDYTVTVTATTTGNYSGSGSQQYTIHPLSLNNASTSITLSANSFVYDASPREPEVLLVKVGDLVVPSASYTISYSTDHTNVGSPQVTVTANTSSNFKDAKSQSYSITKRTITSDMVKLNTNNFVYNGTVQKPTVQAVSGYTITSDDIDVVYPESKDVGVYTVTVTGKAPNNQGTVNLSYSIASNNQSDVNITMAGTDNLTYTGNPITRNITVTKGSGTSPTHLTEDTDYTLVYNNNVNKGTATVNVIGKNGYDFVETKTYEIAARPMTSANGITINLSATSFEYNGSTQKPNVTVTYTYTKTGDTTPTVVTLVEGTDYTLNNPGAVNVSTGNKATITGIGNFTGTMDSPTYAIIAKALTDAAITLYPLANPVYDGTVKEPPVQKVTVGGQVYTSGYTVSYSNNINVETATVKPTVTVSSDGTSTFSGSASTTFVILPKPLADDMVTLNTTSYTYDGTAKEPTATVKDTSLPAALQTLTSGTDYTITYSPDHTTPGEKVATITGQGNFKGSVKKTYTIVGASDVTITLPAGTYTYNGAEHKPVVTVKKGDDLLTLNTDYTVAYSANINAGIATITVTGIGNYDFTQTKTFSIAKKAMTNAMVTLENITFTYNGTTQKPTVTVSDGSPSIITSDDYTISNDGNINAGDYTVTVTATSTGNYSGSGSQTYTINPLSISSGEVNLSYNSIVFNGSVQKPTVQTVYANGHQLTATTDYTISWPGSDYTNQGVKTVTVTGTGNYKDSKSVTYSIAQKEVTSNMIKIANENLTYTGAAQAASVTIEDLVGSTNIITANDYTLTNPTHTDVGNYEVQIVGQGNYKGSATKQYSIVTAGTTGFTVDAIAAQDYTGLPLTPTVVVKKAGTTDVLTENTDYTLAWTNNINAGENTASVTVTGKGNYSGTQTVYFTITPKSLTATGITVTLSPTSFAYTGNTQKPSVTVKDGDAKTLVLNTDYTLVNDGGTAQGTYNVTITGIGNYKDVLTPTYTIGNQSLAGAVVVLNQLDSYVYDGNEKKPGVSEVKVGSVVIPASNYDVAYSGNVNAGTATVTVTGKGNCSGSATATFTITPKTVNSDMIYLSSENLEYTGSNIKPEVTVKDGTKTLALTTDYTLTNAGGTEVGSYEVMITGQGNYKGTAKKQYSIITKGAAGFTVDELTVPLTYTGMPLTPTVTVKKAGTTTVLTLGTDYEVAYADNINVGTATATVTGKGNYSGTRSVNFTINPKPLTDGMVALSSTSFTYNGSEQKPVVSVTDTDNNLPLTQNTDYTVTYPADAISQGTKTVTIRGIGNYTGVITKDYSIGMLSLNNASVTLNELTSYIYDGTEKKPTVREVLVGTLVVPVTGYTVAYPDDIINVGTKTMTITGKGNYTGSTTTNYTVTPKTVTKEMINLSSENLIYTGSTIKPTVTVKDGSKTLIENTDYTLTNDGGKEVGTYSLTITGKGNYTGTASRTFNIITKGASVFSVSDIASVIYNGSEQEPDITVMDNSTSPATVLTEGTHYTVAYSNNKNVGSASVIVTGIGSYAGTVSKNFTILPKTLTGAMVTLSATSFVFNSLAQKPEVTVEDKNAANVSIITDYDYTILNNGGINVGDDHEVKVTGKGNYTGTVTKTYAITPLSIADANVTLYQLQSYVYDSTAKKPGVREVMVGDITVPTTGYDVSYGENTNVGTATVTLTGKGNFKDTKTVNFTITGKPITSDMIVLSSENFIYNGEVQKPTVIVKDGAKTLTLGTDYALTNAGGTSVGTYSVTVAGMGNYASEASRSYSIVEKDGTTNFTISLSNTSVQYNGSAQTPTVTVTDGVKTLTNNTDYEVAYTNHVNVGTATVTVTGKGNYAGTKTTTFTITAKPLTETMVTLSETSFVYNTLIQKPEVSVSDGDIMTKDDYVITNNGGTNQGTYHVIVNGQGNYSGQIDKTFTITPLSIADANVTLYQLQSYVFEGLQKKPGVREVTVGNINVPTQGYTTSYGDNVNAGTASVTVTGQGNFKDAKTVTFEIEPKAVENSMITLSNYEYTYNGEIQKPEVIVRDGETTLVPDTDYSLQNNGGKTVGPYDVTITGKGNYKGTASKTYIINAKEVGSFEVTLSAERVTYNGSEQQPGVTVKDGETVLTMGVHYTVSYTDNVNVGMATVTVRGQGEYEGSRNKTFLIQPKSLSETMVSLNTTTFTYNGLLQMPTVTVTDGTALTSNDYYITNEGGLDKGTYNVMVTGRNNYTGTIVRQYAINPMSISDGQVTLYLLQSYVYDGTAKNPGVREVTVGSHIVPSTSFTTAISSNINVGTVTVTVTGEKNYTGSASTTFEITPKPVTSGMIVLTPDYFYYNGSVQKPGVTVKDGEKNMVEGTDYTVTNDGGTDAGDYEVKVKGIGNYTGEASQSFTILSSGVNTFVVTLEANEFTYDGTAHKPAVTVKMDDRTLTEGTDYTLTYSNNVNAGTATVTMKGVGDYTGEQVKTFLIQPKTLTDQMVTLDKTSFIYNEKVQKPEVTVADGTLMTEDDYTVTNEGGTDEGTYQVVVVGQNNYKGTVIKSFTITREEIHGDDDPEHPDEKPITYTPTEEGSDEVKVSGCEGTETELEQVTSVTVPATFTADGKTYTVVGIAANAFANMPNLTDIYMPDTEEPLDVAEDAIPASATVHTTLALLDDYALMPTLSESFKAGKIQTEVTAKNRYWTFSSGVDVYVPDGVSVYIVREQSNAAVTIVELSDNDLTVSGQRIIKHNNGVLISSEGNDTSYDLVVCGRRMSSGTIISTDDYKDYGSQNCLVPVIQPTHFGAGYYFLKSNEFYSIQEESEDVKVPAGKAVLYLRQAASSPSYSSVIHLVNTGDVTHINGVESDTDEADWYDMSGRKLGSRPAKKGVYIHHNKKVVIR